MTKTLLKNLFFLFLLGACSTASKNSGHVSEYSNSISDNSLQPQIAPEEEPMSLMNLPQSQYGGFILAPGFYEADFKTYCLQPGTPDPVAGDAYIQSPVTGYRKDFVESVLLNSRDKPGMNQKNIQLLLWSIVSGSDYNKLSPSVKLDASQLLSSREIFQLKGGVLGMIKTVSYSTGLMNTNTEMKKLFNTGIQSYETFERLAVPRESPKIIRTDVKYDQWYRQGENYYVRYFPAGYQKTKIQVYVPDSLLDRHGRYNGEYIVFEPTGLQATPAFTNSQRLGVGAPVVEVIRKIIKINSKTGPPKKIPEKKEKTVSPGKNF